MAVSVELGPLLREDCTRGEGRRKCHVPSGTHAITSLTAPSPSSHSRPHSHPPPPNCHITRRFPSSRPIRRTVARRRTGIRGGDDGEQHRDIGRNLLRGLYRHLEFGYEQDLVLDRNNGGNDLFFSPSYSLCQNRPCLGTCDDMQIRSARVFIRIGFG
jgi:hypothetical protein